MISDSEKGVLRRLGNTAGQALPAARPEEYWVRLRRSLHGWSREGMVHNLQRFMFEAERGLLSGPDPGGSEALQVMQGGVDWAQSLATDAMWRGLEELRAAERAEAARASAAREAHALAEARRLDALFTARRESRDRAAQFPLFVANADGTTSMVPSW